MSSVVRTIDGNQVTFRRFTAEEVIDFCEIAYQWRREQLLDAKRSGIDITEAMNTTLGLRGDLNLLWQYARTPTGCTAVLKAAGAEVKCEQLDLYDRAGLALEVCGFRLPEANDERKEVQDGDGFERPT